MEALVKIPVEVAQELLFHCENSSPEYQMLANGIIVDDQLTFRCKTDKPWRSSNGHILASQAACTRLRRLTTIEFISANPTQAIAGFIE